MGSNESNSLAEAAPGREREREPVFNYPEHWRAFWVTHLGRHSLLRCPGAPCPGGCGANAKDDMRSIMAGRDMTTDAWQDRRLANLLADAERK